jgi:hypothetical protein
MCELIVVHCTQEALPWRPVGLIALTLMSDSANTRIYEFAIEISKLANAGP